LTESTESFVEPVPLPQPVPDTSDEPWYAVWVRSHHEYIVDGQLSARGFQTFLPQFRPPAGRRSPSDARLPLFPGYLFVRSALPKERYVSLLKARGVVRVLDAGWTRLTPVPEAELQAIQTLVASGVPLTPHLFTQPGQPVRVTEGPLAGVSGVFLRDTRSWGRLVVSVQMLGRSVSVEMDSAFVEPSR
jgi:transcriptional antiterminator NusG